MTVLSPVADELFASPDHELASALDDVADLDVAAELMTIQDGLSIDAALERVSEDGDHARATIIRARTEAL